MNTQSAFYVLLAKGSSYKKQCINKKAYSLVIDSSTPHWMEKVIRNSFSKSLSQFLSRLAPHTPHKPFLIVSDKSDSSTVFPSQSRGDVSARNTIFLRFWGKSLREGESSVGYIERLVRHEVGHFWFGQRVDTRSLGVGPWFHEGAAEYLSHKIAFESGDIDQEAFYKRNIELINSCYSSLDRGIKRKKNLTRGIIYGCGSTVFWLLDIELSRSSKLSIWEHLKSSLFFEDSSRLNEQSFDKTLSFSKLRPYHKKGELGFSSPESRLLGVAICPKPFPTVPKKIGISLTK